MQAPTVQELQLRAMLDASQEAILTFDAQGSVIDANAAAEHLFRFGQSELKGARVVNLITELRDDLPYFIDQIHQHSANHQTLSLDTFIHTSNAQAVPVQLTLRLLPHTDSTSGERFVALFSDRSRELALQEQLRNALQGLGLKKPDTATVFHTRNYLKERFNEVKTLAMASAPTACVAVACINIDRFKRVNDLLGYDAGDHAITAIGHRIDAFLRHESDANGWDVGMCRLSGDEFALVLISEHPLIGLTDWCKRLQNCLGEPLETHNQRFVFSLSAGVASGVLVHSEFEALLTDSEMSMRAVKMRGGNDCLTYNAQEGQTPRPRATEHNVILGMERKQFQPFFQPKVCSDTGQILGFEALLRWQHPERGLIPLGEFLPVLESSSLMLDVGLQIFEQVVATMAQWQAKGVNLPVSFNVSNGELLSEHFRTSLSRLVKEAGVSPDQIYLEITETVLANLGSTGEDIFNELQQAGFRLSVDDFGVGTSSLSRLRSIPLREIKVDRSFISDVTSSSRDLELLRGIVNLAKNLGLEVVIEGVESPQQLSIAKSLGHLSIQGFCYSRAVNPMQALELIERQPFAIH
ncbi:EAL domain-containing protein [Limnohabitans sp.]|uniref:putative bifunctional diguanylate cyclase/phosphodiesterase n=1 Tax=Limnohabitans sp. TaxID=1907725 RepID=UPI00286FACC9|nr:EAL domain-containing protein [Limnohabitans sp.]